MWEVEQLYKRSLLAKPNGLLLEYMVFVGPPYTYDVSQLIVGTQWATEGDWMNSINECEFLRSTHPPRDPVYCGETIGAREGSQSVSQSVGALASEDPAHEIQHNEFRILRYENIHPGFCGPASAARQGYGKTLT